MKRVYQTLFGCDFEDPATLGNCFPACLATLLCMPLARVPHFVQLKPRAPAEQHADISNWLLEQGYARIMYDWQTVADSPVMVQALVGVTMIVTGPSPRTTFDHAVLGTITSSGKFRLIHDPHVHADVMATWRDGADPSYLELLIPRQLENQHLKWETENVR